MKIFSMVFTVLFFLSFTSIASAESVYTITNKLAADDDDLFIFMTKNIPFDEIDETLSWYESVRRVAYIVNIYILKPGECVSVKTGQFAHLSVVSDNREIALTTLGLDYTTLCTRKDNVCQPNHYEIVNDGNFYDDYVMKIVDQPNSNRNCIDIERWMQIKEQEFFKNH